MTNVWYFGLDSQLILWAVFFGLALSRVWRWRR